MANCPNPPGTLARLNLGPTELDLLGLQLSLPSGICLLLRGGTLSPVVQRALRRQLKKGRKLNLRGVLINDGKGKSKIVLRPAKSVRSNSVVKARASVKGNRCCGKR